MKKIISALLASAMVLSLVACGAAETTTTSEAPAAEATTEAAAPAEAPAADAEGLNILFVSSPSGVDDGSFNQNSYAGVEAFVAAHPGSASMALKETSGDVEACISFLEQNVADYDVIVACGFQFGALGDIADDNPDKIFILVDSTATYADGSPATCANVYTESYAEQESGFFGGIAAALETKTGKVAVVNGIAYPSNVNYQYGFMCGVYYANAKLGTNAEIVELASRAGEDVTGANVKGNYIGSFADEATGKVVGEELIAEGCDVIFVAAGASGNGVFAAAKETENVMIIGCDADQYGFGDNGSRNIILTSVLKRMDVINERELNVIADGAFEAKDDLLNAAVQGTGIVTVDGRHQMAADTVSAVSEAVEAVASGEVVPASNFGVTLDEFQATLN